MSGIVSDLALPISRRVIASPSVVWLPDAVRHVLASAIVYINGTSLRVSFGGLMAATTPAAGWSVTDGGLPVAISSAVINGRILDITLAAPVTINGVVLLSFNAGLSDLTVIGSGVPFPSFSNRPVQNLSWSGGALWTPASHGTNLDYGIDSDLTRLFQTNADTTPVVSVGDPVGRWRGQRDVLAFNQGTAANRPAYRAAGIEFDSSGGVQKSLFASRAANLTSPFSLFLQTTASAGISGGLSLYGTHSGGNMTGINGATGTSNYQCPVRGLFTTTDQPKSAGKVCIGMVWDGTNGTFFNDDGETSTHAPGSASNNFTGFTIGSAINSGGGVPIAHAWAAGSAGMTVDDFKKHAWWARYAA